MLRTTLTLMTALLTLAGCATFPAHDGAPPPRLTLEHLSGLPLSVGTVSVKTAYSPSAATAAASRDFSINLDDALLAYGHKRLSGGGGEGRLEYVVERAELIKQRLSPQNQVAQWAKVDYRDQYDADIALRLVTFDATGREVKNANLNFRRSIVIPDTVTLAERDKRRLNFQEQIIRDVDQGVIRALTGSLFVLSSSDAPGGAAPKKVGMNPVVNNAPPVQDAKPAVPASPSQPIVPPY